MLQKSGLPQNMWVEALLTTNYILNKIPHKVTSKTPYELWKGNLSSYKYLKVWGCLAKVAVPPQKNVTIWPKTVDCIFIGYAHNSSAYRFMVHLSSEIFFHTRKKRFKTNSKIKRQRQGLRNWDKNRDFYKWYLRKWRKIWTLKKQKSSKGNIFWWRFLNDIFSRKCSKNFGRSHGFTRRAILERSCQKWIWFYHKKLYMIHNRFTTWLQSIRK